MSILSCLICLSCVIVGCCSCLVTVPTRSAASIFHVCFSLSAGVQRILRRQRVLLLRPSVWGRVLVSSDARVVGSGRAFNPLPIFFSSHRKMESVLRQVLQQQTTPRKHTAMYHDHYSVRAWLVGVNHVKHVLTYRHVPRGTHVFCYLALGSALLQCCSPRLQGKGHTK